MIVVGDIVELHSGSPRLRVIAVEGDSALCWLWLHNWHAEPFRFALLRKIGHVYAREWGPS